VSVCCLVDALGTPKAAYYAAKRFFSPVLVSLKEEGSHTQVWVTNQSASPFQNEIFAEVGDFLGRRALEKRIPISLAPGESRCVYTFRVGGRFAPNVVIANRQRLYYAAAWIPGQQRFARRFFEKQKDLLLPPAHLDAKRQAGGWRIRTDVYARQAAIDGELNGLEFSDNWFDLLPGQQRDIDVRVVHGKPLEQRHLTLSALNAAPRTL